MRLLKDKLAGSFGNGPVRYGRHLDWLWRRAWMPRLGHEPRLPRAVDRALRCINCAPPRISASAHLSPPTPWLSPFLESPAACDSSRLLAFLRFF